MFGIAESAWVLIVSRTLQGLSSAIVYTVGLALLADTAKQEVVSEWMGTALSSSSFGLIISPLLGGFLYEMAGYNFVFGICLVVILIDILMRVLLIDKRDALKYAECAHPTTQASTRDSYGTFASTSAGQKIRCAAPSSYSWESETVAPTQAVTQLLHTLPDYQTRKPSSSFSKLLTSRRVLAALYGIFVNVSILASFDGVLARFVQHLFQ